VNWQRIALNTLCLLLALVALTAVAWALITGQAGEQGVDGLFLVIVGLFIALLFSIIPLQAIRQGWLKEWLARRHATTAEEKKARVAATPSREPQ
jgi:hypothetical protein